MADNAPTVGWICTDPLLLMMVDALLDETYEDRSIVPGDTKEHRLGRVGSVNIIISLAESPSAANTVRIADNMTTEFASIEAVLITGFSAGVVSAGVNLGDVVIRPAITSSAHDAKSSSPLMPNILHSAVDVLQREVGADGRWLSSNLPPSSDLFQFTHPANNDLPDYPKLHYEIIGPERQDIRSPDFGDELGNSTMCFDTLAAGFKRFPVPVVAILGISKCIESPKNNTSKRYAAANATAYAKELLQVMRNNLVRSVDDMTDTEKIVPPPQVNPSLSPFQRHQYPSYGSAVLLVIPTENKNKRRMLEEAFRERAPKNVVVHVITVPVDSNVGEEPYNNAGAIGAHNRISNALTRLGTSEYQNVLTTKGIGTVIVASIESYIQTENIDRPTDYGIVVVHNATSCKTAARVSSGVTVPLAYVNRARRFGYEDQNQGRVTVGQILAANVPGLNKGDWHAVLAGRSRYDLLRDAIRQIQIPW